MALMENRMEDGERWREPASEIASSCLTQYLLLT
jgi:hypothetical protein